MRSRLLPLALALLAGCASETPRERAARRAEESRAREAAAGPERDDGAPRSGVSAGGTRGPARRDLRPAFPSSAPAPPAPPPVDPALAPRAEPEDERPTEPASSLPRADAPAPGPPGGDAPAPPGGDDLAAAERWLDDAERWLDAHPAAEARAERGRVGRDLERLDADLDRQDGEVRQDLAAKGDERRAAVAEVERRAAERDRRERDELRAKHEPPVGVVVIPADEWRIRYERDLAQLVPIQERRLAAERTIVEARHDKEVRPLHAEKQAIARVRFRLAVLLRRVEEGT